MGGEIKVRKLGEDLRAAGDARLGEERLRKATEALIKDLQARLDEAELGGPKGPAQPRLRLTGRRGRAGAGGGLRVAKLEERIRALEADAGAERHRLIDAHKAAATSERRLKELSFAVEEERKVEEPSQGHHG